MFSAGAVHGGPWCPSSLPPTPWGLQGNNIFPGFWNWLIFSGAQRPPECRLRVGLRVGRGRQHDEQHRHRRRLHPLQHEHHRHQPQHHVSGDIFLQQGWKLILSTRLRAWHSILSTFTFFLRLVLARLLPRVQRATVPFYIFKYFTEGKTGRKNR